MPEQPAPQTPEAEALKTEAPDSSVENSPEAPEVDVPEDVTPAAEAGAEAPPSPPEVEAPEGGAPKADPTDWKDKYLRLSAEFDNFRKRTAREKLQLSDRIREDTLRALFPALDNLQRALTAAQSTDSVEKLKEGLALLEKQLVQTLEKQGIVRFGNIGELFNPDLHEAITTLPVEDAAQKGAVVDVVEFGYRVEERVIRPAKVITGA